MCYQPSMQMAPAELGRAVCGGSGQEKSQDVLFAHYTVVPNVIPNAPFLLCFFVCFLLLFGHTAWHGRS